MIRPADQRNGAVGAAVAASVGELDIGGIGGGGQHARRAEEAIALAGEQRVRALVGLLNGGKQLLIGGHAHQQVDLGNFGAQIFTIALHEAARDDQHAAFSALFVFGHIENRVDRFFLCGEYEAAGVDDDDLGLARIGDNGVARLAEHAQHDLAVHAVFRAAQRHQTNGFHVIRIVLPYESISPRRNAEKSAFR